MQASEQVLNEQASITPTPQVDQEVCVHDGRDFDANLLINAAIRRRLRRR
ncbi:hypothetical protein AB0E12_18305 [Micromonospora chersina]